MFTVVYKHWNPAGGTTPGIRRFKTKEQLVEYLNLLLMDETLIDFHVTTPNPMLV